MPVFKYRDPNTDEWVSVGGGTSIPASDTEPTSGNYWLDTSAEGGTYYTAGEVDALLANKAPAGYVTGNYDIRDYDSLDAILDTLYGNMQNFSAQVVTIADNGGTTWGGCIYFTVIKRVTADWGVVDFVSYDNTGNALRKARVQGVWQSLEWVNPPMTIGVEYRTTERYKGKPVYCQLVSFGTLPNSGLVYVEIAGMETLISATGTFSNNRYIPQFSIGSGGFGFDRAIAFTSDNDSVGIIVNSSVANGQTAYGFIKYTRD